MSSLADKLLGFPPWLALALIFHPVWLVEGAQRRSEFNAFFGHLAMIGGMLYVYAFGAGAWSLDRAQGHARLEPASLPAR